MALGQRIKEIRINLGETMEEFANTIREKTDNTQRTGKSNVSKWERGENIPNDITLKAIAALAGISVDELLDDTCQWQFIGKFTYTTSCCRTFFDDENYNHIDSDFEFCPYCGKLIEFKED